MATQYSESRIRIATGVALAMALGPLTALSFGTQYADEETWERATAGIAASQPANPLAAYDLTAQVPEYVKGRSVLDIAEGASLFDRFEAAVKSAALDSLLDSETPHTVFLPMNEAFAKLSEQQVQAMLDDPQQIRQLVESHIVPGRLAATDLMRVGSVMTLNGKSLPVAIKEDPTVGNARIVKTEVAENGVVHVVDAVL